MSKQSRKVSDRLRASKTLILPESQDPRQQWLVVRRDPSDNKPGCFFVTHARNKAKFASRSGHEIMVETWDRAAATAMAHRATVVCGPAYQPKNSAHAGPVFQEAEKPSFESLFGPTSLDQSGKLDNASPEGPAQPDPSKLN